MPRPRLPLRPGTTGPPLIVTEVICWAIVPDLHLKEYATSFDQFKGDNAGKMMRAVFQFFLMVICEASAKEGFTFHIEGVYNDADEMIGYRFFGFLTGTDGETFAQIAASLLNRYEEEAKKPVTGRRLARRFESDKLWPHEAYYALCNPDARLFGVAAAVFTGIEPPDGLSSEELIKFFFLPDTQFVCTIDIACAAQGDCGMYFQEPPGCHGLSVTFPFQVYTVPFDFLKFTTLFQLMLPDAQKQRARATMVSKVIIDALKSDSVPVEPDLKRQRILRQLGAQEFVHTQAAAVEDFAGVRGSDPPPLTVFDQPRRDNNEILKSLADLEERKQGPPRLGMIPPLTNSTSFKVFCDQDAKNQRTMASIYHSYQRSAGETLKGLLNGDGLSPAYQALADEGKTLNDPDLSRWFYENGDKNLTHNLNTEAKLVVMFEQVCGVTDTHEIGSLVEKATLDATRRGSDLHTNVFIATENGATGKTSIVKWVLRLRVAGTVKDIVFATAAALLTSGINGQSDQAGYITFFDEQPPESAAGDANGISKEQARKKHQLSNGGHVKVLYFDKEDGGDRETKQAEADWCGVEICLSNIAGMSHALESRYIMVRPSEKASVHGRRIENSMNEATQAEEITGPMFERVAQVFQQRQWFHFMVHRCVESGYIKAPSMHGAALFLNKFIDELQAMGVLFKTPRVNSNIHAMAKIECISEAYQNFLVDHKGLITVESFRKIEPLLSVSVDNMIAAIMELAESICPNLPHGISCCIRDLYHRKAAAARAALDTKPFENLFAINVGSNDRDYSWFSVPKQELVEFAAVHVSDYTNGIQPSKRQIHDAIDGFCDSAEAEYCPYGFIISAEGKFRGQPDVVSCPGVVRTQCARLIDTHFKGVKQFEVHMGFIYSVDSEKTPKQTIVCAIKKALNYKHQLEHVFSTGKEQGSPKLMLETFTPDSDEELVVKTHVVANAHTQSFFSGYQKEVFGSGPSSDGRLQTDFDTFGVLRRNQQIYRDFSVPEIDIGALLGGDDETCFFGTPVQKLTMDNLIIGPEKKRLLKRTLEEEGNDDFEPEDYATDGVYHWEIIAENVPSQCLGFSEWLEGDQLMQQYRLICTHPYVIRDRQKRQAVFRREDYKHYTMYHWERLVYEGLLDSEDAENKYKAICHEPWVIEHRRAEPFNKEDYLIDPDCQDVYHWDVMKRDGHFEGLEGDALWQAYAKIRNEPDTLKHFAKSREIEY